MVGRRKKQSEVVDDAEDTPDEPVDVRANGDVAFPGLTNPKEAKADLPAGTITADVTLAGTDTVANGPADVELTDWRGRRR